MAFKIEKICGNNLYYHCNVCDTRSKCMVKDLKDNTFITITCPFCLQTNNVLVNANDTADLSWSPVIWTEIIIIGGNNE